VSYWQFPSNRSDSPGSRGSRRCRSSSPAASSAARARWTRTPALLRRDPAVASEVFSRSGRRSRYAAEGVGVFGLERRQRAQSRTRTPPDGAPRPDRFGLSRAPRQRGFRRPARGSGRRGRCATGGRTRPPQTPPSRTLPARSMPRTNAFCNLARRGLGFGAPLEEGEGAWWLSTSAAPPRRRRRDGGFGRRSRVIHGEGRGAATGSGGRPAWSATAAGGRAAAALSAAAAGAAATASLAGWLAPGCLQSQLSA
jgi:hypothetical protein